MYVIFTYRARISLAEASFILSVIFVRMHCILFLLPVYRRFFNLFAFGSFLENISSRGRPVAAAAALSRISA